MKKYIIALSLLFPMFVSAQGFDQNLYYGLRSNESVKELQEFLTDKGFYSGPITGNFFSLTLSAVKKFQSANSISSTGYFGPLSRTKANELLADSGISETEIVTEEGTTTPAVVSTPKTTDDVVNSLLEQIRLIQQQLTLLKQQQATLEQQNQQIAQQTQVIQQQTKVIQQQSETVQQIQQQTVPTVISTPSPAPVPISQARLDLGFAWNKIESIVATGWNVKQVYAQVYGDNGEKLKNIQIDITTPDVAQNKSINYAREGVYDGVQDAFWFSYYPRTVGIHIITFSVPALGLSKSISLEAKQYNRIIPAMKFGAPVLSPKTIEINYPYSQSITEIRIDCPDLNDSYYLRDVSYKIISDTFSAQDVNLSLWSGNEKLDNKIPFSGAIPIGSSKNLTIKMDSASKSGKFKLSISVRFFSVNEAAENPDPVYPNLGKEFILSNLPITTAEIEVK
ncbi:MAG: peptidoglycan-binding domain-containing protein [Candidatus Pacebacteria bacterium]|nr:peptidoglycan-binding domain-containing protein [Candidatus Paceibacterota bacterium]